MRRARPLDEKAEELRASRVLNPKAGDVRDPLFEANPFFDARDLVQVRYEMVRRISAEHLPISRVATSFGVTKPTVYSAQRRFLHGGLLALVPRPAGPKSARKLKGPAFDFLIELRSSQPSATLAELAAEVNARFGLTVHPSSVLRALRRAQKKPPRRRARKNPGSSLGGTRK